MEEKVNSFIKLFTHFKESPLQFLTLLAVIFGMFMVYTEIDYIKSFIPDPEEERRVFEQALKTNELINDSLDNVREVTGAKAVAIAQFHNGRYDLTRLPFTSVTITYYQGETNLENGIVLQTRPLSSMNRLMRDMWLRPKNPKCITAETSKISDDLYRARLVESGAQFVSLCPLQNILDYPIGYHAIALDRIPTEEEKALILAIQRPQAQRVAGYLQTLDD